MSFNPSSRRILVVMAAVLASFGVKFGSNQVVHAATTWTVTTTADDAPGGVCSTPCTLRDALSSAANGDTIQFTGLTGTITLGSAGPLTIGTNVTINGPGALTLAVDGNNTVNVFIIESSITTSISGLTIQHGNSSMGSGIYNLGTLTISNSTVSNNSSNGTAGNSSGYGGGIYSNGGALTITNSTLANNHANTLGGGIYIENGTVTISHSTISGNSTTWGGAGLFNNGMLTLNNTTVSDNSTAFGQGGAGYNTGTLTINNSTLSGNYASDCGGIQNAGILAVNNSTFSGNTGDNGGAIRNDSNGANTISNSTFSGNSGFSGGGAVFNEGALSVSNSTFSNNSVGGGGGAIANYGTMSVGNTTIAGNSADFGGGVFNHQGVLNLFSNIIANNLDTTIGPDVDLYTGTISSIGYNVIGDGSNSGIVATTGDQIGTSGNPIDPTSAPWLPMMAQHKQWLFLITVPPIERAIAAVMLALCLQYPQFRLISAVWHARVY